MKRLKKIFLFSVALVALIYALVFIGHRIVFPMPVAHQATIPKIENKNFSLGAASHKQPQTTAAYLKVLAEQVKIYNQKAPELWPDNNEINQAVITQDVTTQKAQLITPTGQLKPLSATELKKYHIAGPATNGGWSKISTNGVSGAYLPIDPNALTNFYTFQRYEHLGTYDPFITFAHELFHALPQEKWATSKFGNRERDERDTDTAARKKRMLLQQQLALAISEPARQTEHLNDALATYADYQKKNPRDARATLLSDRLEGSAYYYELKASLYAGYPQQIKTEADVQQALSLLLKDDNPAYRDSGAVIEGYAIGAYAGILLDRLAKEKHEDPNAWKKTLAQDGETTPLTLLQKVANPAQLPAAKPVPSQKEFEHWLAGAEKIAPKGNAPQNFFNFAYDLLY
ncbi:hypothetical protein [Enterococcus sp. CSURQ0835]|uniref:hypothetical protein n=1 Tax=Enterococcus sp. CSURQ0835 TaxID=2681394 RepID=UPI001359423C|nr:hypothetical protein [Enterococcus sp. CSURQ0835]